MKKTCTKCEIEKDLSEYYFHPYSNYRDKIHPWCRPCFRECIRNTYLKRTYGITSEQYNDMLEDQDMGCAICLKKKDTHLPLSGKNKMLAVDHNPLTGEIRGILCENCNRGIGLMMHDAKLLQRAMDYLNQFT